MPSVNDSYKELINSYNGYRQTGDNASALRVARDIVKIADGQCAMDNVHPTYKDYYRSSSASVREFIVQMSMGNLHTPAKKTSGKNSDQIKSTDWFAADIPHLTMNDTAGLRDVKYEFMVNVFAPTSPIPEYSAIYKKYRQDMGLQILLYGPPGTGKTHIVKCLAGQLGCKIAVVQIKDVMANLVGDGAKIIAEIFEQAKKYDKCIIFFDEIDAIAASRDDEESRHTKEQLTTLLTNMDGFTAGVKPGQIRIIVAATNRPWILDSAVKRGGRFDTQIYVPLPDYDARHKLISIALGKDKSVKTRLEIPCASDVTVEWLTEKFEGYAGADIKAACRQIINRPLRREIMSYAEHKQLTNDCITRQDCEEVMSKYINSITDEMLFMFDAYAANLDVLEYLKIYESKARALREEGQPLPAHVIRWLNKIDEMSRRKFESDDI